MQNKIYLCMLQALMFSAALETIGAMFEPFCGDSATARTMVRASAYLYFIFHTVILPMLGYYVLCITGIYRKLTAKRHLLFLLPFLAAELLMLTNPLNHWSYYYDSAMVFNRDWGEVVLYAVGGFYLIFVLLTFFRSWQAVNRRRRNALSFIVALTVAGVIIQLCDVNLQVELFAEAMAFLGLMLTTENDDDLLDAETGIYNRKAFRLDMENHLANRQVIHVLCVRIRNVDLIRRITGTYNTDILSIALLKEFSTFVPRYQIYQTAPDTFLLTLIEADTDRALSLARAVRKRFASSWRIQNNEFILKSAVILVRVPEEIGEVRELLNLADSPLPPEQDTDLYYGEALSYLLRRRAVENAIQRGLEEGGFQVYYQPTFGIRDRRIHGAEALVRLTDPQLGMMMPDEFIPVAEQIGLINEVDDLVLREVCAFLAGGEPARLGIVCLNVNLSVLQCIQPGFVDHVLAIVEKSGADRRKLNFEITESVGAEDYGTLEEVIRQFHAQGFRVYMDDYGTGYSNMQAIFSMDFDVVKIDKSILWGAQDNRLGMIILENCVRMIKQMERKVLVEGVETEEQITLLEKLGVDYLQGFYFSPPIPRDKLAALLRAEGAAKG